MKRLPQTEAGFTLVEALVGVAITGIMAAGIVGAMGTLVMGSDRAQKLGDAGSLSVSAAEVMSDYGLPYAIPPVPAKVPFEDSCNPSYGPGFTFDNVAGFSTPAEMKLTPADVSVVAVDFWDGTKFDAACVPGSDFQLQRITIRVESGDKRAHRDIQVVKRG